MYGTICDAHTLFCFQTTIFYDAWRRYQTQLEERALSETALFMTEFGAVGTSATGLREVQIVADGADALQPPVSWAYWAWDAFKGPLGNVSKTWDAISRSYAPVVDGTLESIRGGGSDTRFEMIYKTGAPNGQGDGQTHIYFAPGLQDTTITVEPKGAVDFNDCSPDCIPGATELILFNNVGHTRVKIVIEKTKTEILSGV